MEIHKEVKDYVCPHCNKGFKARKVFARHLKIHTGEKPHHCDICGKDFLQRIALKVHMRTHNNGPKRFQCLVCQKDFNHKVSLKEHMNRHHNESEKQAAIMIGLWTKYKVEEGIEEETEEKKDLLTRALTAVALENNTPIPPERELPRSILPTKVSLNKDLPHIDMEIEVAKKHEERQSYIPKVKSYKKDDSKQGCAPGDSKMTKRIKSRKESAPNDDIITPRPPPQEPSNIDPYRNYSQNLLDSTSSLLTRAYDIARSPITTRSDDSYRAFDFAPSLLARHHLSAGSMASVFPTSSSNLRMTEASTLADKHVTVIVSSQNYSSSVNVSTNVYSSERDAHSAVATTLAPLASSSRGFPPFGFPYSSPVMSGPQLSHMQSLINPYSEHERMAHLNQSQTIVSTSAQWTQM